MGGAFAAVECALAIAKADHADGDDLRLGYAAFSAPRASRWNHLEWLKTRTATFRLLYVFVVIEHGSRRLMHVNVTAHPSAGWTLQRMREVVADTDEYRYLLHDRDGIFARHLDDSIRAMDLAVLRSPFASPKEVVEKA